MNRVLAELIKLNITDPAQIRAIAWMIANAANGSNMMKNNAEDLTALSDQQINLATQQILGGR